MLRFVMSLALAGALALETAVAQANIPNSAVATVRSLDLDVRLVGSRQRILLDTMARWTHLPHPPAVVFDAAHRTLKSLEVPIATADSARGVVYHTAFVPRGKLAQQALSTFLNCGSGMTGPYADAWRVNAAYAVFARPKGDGTDFGVALIANARDIQGVSTPMVSCTSTGRFEQYITSIVAAGL